MGLLNKGAILGADDLKCRDVEVPEWGGIVRLRQLTLAQLDQVRQDFHGGQVSMLKSAANMVAASLVDETGAPLLQPDEFAALQQRHPRVIERLANVCNELNEFTAEAAESAKKN